MNQKCNDREIGLIQSARAASDGSGVLRDAAAHAIEITGYTILREITRGGQGVIYQAVQESTGRYVAIKMLRHGAFATGAEHTRLEREIRILAQLKHPGIVTIHDSGTVAGVPYYVMDNIDGAPLDLYVERARLSQTERLELFLQVADAVQAAHVRGVMHRDLKPSNILVDEDGRPHIVDFGLGKLLDGATASTATTETGHFVGSLLWSAPEQVRGDSASVDVRTDVYALGVIFWRVFTNGFPYDVVGDVGGVLENICSAQPSRSDPCGDRLPADLETILRKCLSKEPTRRYQNAGALADDLRCCLDGLPIAARRDSQLYVLRKIVARHRVVFVLAAALLVIAIGSAIGFAIMYGHSEQVLREVQRANQELRHGLFAAVPSLRSMTDALDVANQERFFMHSGSIRRETNRLVLDCRNGSDSAITLIPSRSVLRGDFDISFDYEIIDMPELRTGAVQIILILLDVRTGMRSTWVTRYHEHDPQCPGFPEQCYTSGGDGNCPPAHAATQDVVGRLRISRRATTASTYYWADGDWRPLFSRPTTDDVLGFEICARAILTQQPFTVAVSNLSVRTVFPTEPECLRELDDGFSGRNIDPRFICESAFGSPSEEGGQLRFRKQNGYDGVIRCKLDTTRYHVCGDFDLSVDFALAEFPETPNGRHFVRLGILDAQSDELIAGLERIREPRGASDRGDFFRAFAHARELHLPSDAMEGTLVAVRRENNIVFSVMLDELRQIATLPLTGEPVTLELSSGAADRTHAHDVRFDNLRLVTSGLE